MCDIIQFSEMIIATDEKKNIKIKLENIKEINNWLDIDCEHLLHRIDITKWKIDVVEQIQLKYKTIAKLSSDLYLDYNYYKEFPIKIKPIFQNCEEELRSLGYSLKENGVWINEHKPDSSKLVDYIFTSCLLQSIFTKLIESHPGYVVNKSRGFKERNDKICQDSQTFAGMETELKVKNDGMNQKNKKKEKSGMKDAVRKKMSGDCLDDRYEEWRCCYRFCSAINKPNDKYCKKCGIVRMTNPVYNASVICYDKNYMCTKVWICEKCDTINEGEKKETCPKCDPGMRDTGKDKIINDGPLQGEIQKINEGDKWKCSGCQSVNDRAFLSCRQCNKARIEIWRCPRCTVDNKILINQCAACEWKRYCKRCKKNESMVDGKCAECMLTKETTWSCPYRLCGNKNYGYDKYCRHCGLDRSESGKNEGSLTRCLNGKNESVRICKYQLCSAINDQYYQYCNQCGLERFLSFGRGEPVDRQVNCTKDKVWICSYQMCQKINNVNVDFCYHCGLYRYFGCDRIAAIKRHWNGQMDQIWICSDCSNMNAVDQSNCTRQLCHSKRNIQYKWCMNCKDGKISMGAHRCSSCKC